jgi:hypothetical protein
MAEGCRSSWRWELIPPATLMSSINAGCALPLFARIAAGHRLWNGWVGAEHRTASFAVEQHTLEQAIDLSNAQDVGRGANAFRLTRPYGPAREHEVLQRANVSNAFRLTRPYGRTREERDALHRQGVVSNAFRLRNSPLKPPLSATSSRIRDVEIDLQNLSIIEQLIHKKLYPC